MSNRTRNDLKDRATRRTEGEILMRHFCEALDAGDVPPQELLEWIAKAFLAIRAGEDPKLALSLTPPVGRKPDTIAKYEKGEAAVVASMKELRETMKYGPARVATMKRLKISKRTFEKRHGNYKKLMDGMRRWLAPYRN